MEQPSKKSPDEIDLLYFFNPLFRGAKRLGAGFSAYLSLLKRNAVVFLLILFTVAGIGFLLRYVLPKYYKSDAVFASYNLPGDYGTLMIKSLQNQIGEAENVPTLAKQMNIPAGDVAAIRSLSAEPADSFITVNGSDTTVASAFRVELTAMNTGSIPKIQEGLFYFLENNEFARRRKEARRRTLESLKANFIQKSRGLDSLNVLLSTAIVPRSSGQGIILGEPISPVDVYELQETYYRQQLKTEEELALLQNVEIIQPFYATNASNYPDFNELFMYSVLIGLGLALLLTPVIGKR